ncbi:hypothetical protein KKB99_05155, partial [bacterium]|nr:hypothetical protein [bacterium]MBU1025385.1 hypothetical protein [bacterium]
MYRLPITGFIITVLLIMLTGCSGGGGAKSPIIPELVDNNDNTPAAEGGFAGYIPEGLAEGGTLPMIFGIFEVNIDPVSLTGDITSLRMAEKLGDSFMVDVTPFLTINPCADCVDIKSVALTPENYIEVVFRTKHPFDPGARLDLHVFDLRGIIVTGDNAKQFDDLRIDMDGDGTYESP